jgi:hypothetical protein
MLNYYKLVYKVTFYHGFNENTGYNIIYSYKL